MIAHASRTSLAMGSAFALCLLLTLLVVSTARAQESDGGANLGSLVNEPLQIAVLTNSCGSNQAQQFFEVTNTGSIPINLSDISIKFWVYDTSGQSVVPHVWTGGCVTGVGGNPSCVHQVQGVSPAAVQFTPACGTPPTQLANWEITITDTDSGQLPPGATWSNIQAALNLANYSNFIPGTADWYSGCLTGSSYATSPSFAVYYQGNLVNSPEVSVPSCRAPESVQIQAYLDSRYNSEDVELSFTTPLGDTVDCVNFFKQPGVVALLAQGVPITAIPERGSGFGVLAGCPSDAVPMIRVTPAMIFQTGGLNAYLSALHRKVIAPIASPFVGEDYCGYAHQVAQLNDVTAYGGQTFLNIVSPNAQNDQHSLAQLWFGAGPLSPLPSGTCNPEPQPCTSTGPDCVQTIEVGWDVDFSLFSSLAPHLFTFSTNDNYDTTGCYNNMASSSSEACLPWVQVSQQFAPAMNLNEYVQGWEAYSGSTPAPLTDLAIEVAKYSDTGGLSGWGIFICIGPTDVGPNCDLMGVYPFTDYYPPMDNGDGNARGTFFHVGAEVNDATLQQNGVECGFGVPPSPQMGEGLCIGEPESQTAYAHDYYYLGSIEGAFDWTSTTSFYSIGNPVYVPQSSQDVFTSCDDSYCSQYAYPANPLGPGDGDWVNWLYYGTQ